MKYYVSANGKYDIEIYNDTVVTDFPVMLYSDRSLAEVAIERCNTSPRSRYGFCDDYKIYEVLELNKNYGEN